MTHSVYVMLNCAVSHFAVVTQEHIWNVLAVLYSVVLKVADKDSPGNLNFAIICFNIKAFVHISEQTQFATLMCHESFHNVALVVIVVSCILSYIYL